MSQPKRILQIVTQMNRGGLETMIMNYYRNVDRSKIQFDFLTHRSDKKDYDDEIESLGGKIYHLPRLNPFSPSYRKALKTFFNEHPEYQVVHCHLDCMSSLPLYYAKKAGVKYRIAHAHSTSQDKNIKFMIKKHYMKKIPALTTHLFACGQKAGEWMFGGAPFEVLYNAINLDDFTYNENLRVQMRKEEDVESSLVIGHVGRFSYPKNHEFLIDVFHEIHKQNNKAVLMLVGTGELEEKIKDKTKQLGLTDHVKFLGLRSDIYALLNAMDGFVFPSHYEGLPVSIVEAQATGLPCFISNYVPNECVITENVKTISLESDSYVWANEILSTLNDFKRKNEDESIIKAGFDIKENAKALQRIYLEME